MRVTWIVVCERFAHLSGGEHVAHRIYFDPIPWRPPSIYLPIAAAFLVEGEGPFPVPVSVRLLSPRGRVDAFILGKLVGPAAGPQRPHPGFLDGHVKIAAPGEYEIQALVEGQAVDDAPTWRLTVR